MPWYAFAFLCAVLLSAATLSEKRALNKVHTLDFTAALSLLNLLLSLPFLLMVKSRIDGQELIFLLVSAALAAVSFFLVAKGMRHMEVSVVSPLLALSPGTSSILAFVFLGEALSPVEIAGIALMIVGSYILATKGGISLAEPISFVKKSPYVRFILLSLVFYSFGAVMDRTLLSRFSVSIPTYMLYFHAFMALFTIPIVAYFGATARGVAAAFKTSGTDLAFGAIFTVGYRYFQMEALSLASVGLVSAVKRSSSLFTTLIGGELFHERNLGRKLFACLTIIIGSALIVL
jgi:drug/metabolite transporter (DMT)-like permease